MDSKSGADEQDIRSEMKNNASFNVTNSCGTTRVERVMSSTSIELFPMSEPQLLNGHGIWRAARTGSGTILAFMVVAMVLGIQQHSMLRHKTGVVVRQTFWGCKKSFQSQIGFGLLAHACYYC